MKRIFLILVIALCGSAAAAFAQDAVVVELSKPDAEQAKQLYEAKQAADKAWDDFYSGTVNKYQGFPSGADFSKDFRFIVPKASPSASTCCYYYSSWSNCGNTLWFTAPSTGTYAAPMASPGISYSWVQ